METRNSLLGSGNRVGAAPTPLNLAPTALVRGVTVPLQRSQGEEEDEDDDLLVAEGQRSRSGITPATGDSWADAHVLPSADIVKLGQADDDEEVPLTKVQKKDEEAVEVESKGKGKERERVAEVEELHGAGSTPEGVVNEEQPHEEQAKELSEGS